MYVLASLIRKSISNGLFEIRLHKFIISLSAGIRLLTIFSFEIRLLMSEKIIKNN